MRRLFAAALCAALSGCVTDEPPQPLQILPAANPAHDAHCRSLQMYPGTLVYVQCRLALSETLRESEERARRSLSPDGVFLPADLEAALREHVFCNFNESSKLSVGAGEPPALAGAAYGRCTETQGRLEQAVRGWQPVQADQLLAVYASDINATNAATITEARSFR